MPVVQESTKKGFQTSSGKAALALPSALSRTRFPSCFLRLPAVFQGGLLGDRGSSFALLAGSLPCVLCTEGLILLLRTIRKACKIFSDFSIPSPMKSWVTVSHSACEIALILRLTSFRFMGEEGKMTLKGLSSSITASFLAYIDKQNSELRHNLAKILGCQLNYSDNEGLVSFMRNA